MTIFAAVEVRTDADWLVRPLNEVDEEIIVRGLRAIHGGDFVAEALAELGGVAADALLSAEEDHYELGSVNLKLWTARKWPPQPAVICGPFTALEMDLKLFCLSPPNRTGGHCARPQPRRRAAQRPECEVWK